MRNFIHTTLPAARAMAMTIALLGTVSCGDDEPSGPGQPDTGSVEVTTVTTGGSVDLDGYSVSVGGGAGQAIGVNATVTVTDVAAGTRSVELTGVAAGCTVAGANPRNVTVVAGETATTQFDVACTTLGTVAVTTVTTGGSVDLDGYSVSVGGGAGQAIGVNETVTVTDVAAGTQSVELTGVAANCTVAGANPRDVTVAAGATTSTQFDIACTLVPISGQILFDSESDDVDGEIFVMNEDGSNPVNLTNAADDDFTPNVSHDGTKIAFYADRDGNDEIYVMNADGTGQTNLTNNAADDRLPAWSPDGSQLLFTSVREGNPQIFVMNADGSGVVNLTNTPGATNVGADWSPDGSQVVFATTRDGNPEIYVMDADGSNPARLTNYNDADVGPAWSPDGTQILFTRSLGDNLEIFVMNADGSNPTNLTNDPDDDLFPSWSPDGSQVLFASDRDGDEEVYVMNADGTGQTNLTNSPETGDFPGFPHAWR